MHTAYTPKYQPAHLPPRTPHSPTPAHKTCEVLGVQCPLLRVCILRRTKCTVCSVQCAVCAGCSTLSVPCAVLYTDCMVCRACRAQYAKFTVYNCRVRGGALCVVQSVHCALCTLYSVQYVLSPQVGPKTQFWLGSLWLRSPSWCDKFFSLLCRGIAYLKPTSHPLTWLHLTLKPPEHRVNYITHGRAFSTHSVLSETPCCGL